MRWNCCAPPGTESNAHQPAVPRGYLCTYTCTTYICRRGILFLSFSLTYFLSLSPVTCLYLYPPFLPFLTLFYLSTPFSFSLPSMDKFSLVEKESRVFFDTALLKLLINQFPPSLCTNSNLCPMLPDVPESAAMRMDSQVTEHAFRRG